MKIYKNGLESLFSKKIVIYLIVLTLSIVVTGCKDNKKKDPVESISTTSIENKVEQPPDIQDVKEELLEEVLNLQDDEHSWLIQGLIKYAKYQIDSNVDAELPKYDEMQSFKDGNEITAAFLLWIEKNVSANIIQDLVSSLQENKYTDNIWYEFTGNTVKVLWDMYAGKLDSDEIAAQNNIYLIEAANEEVINLTFAGDINFDENWSTMQFYDKQENGSFDCLSENLINEMVSADIMMLNNEFTYSSRGESLPGKAYTFRANPNRVNILRDWGVDIVSLANNHTFDYGADSFYDTLSTLDGANINYVGAGKDINEAMKPVYYVVNGKKIAFVSATRAEKNILTPEATKDEPGVLRTYDSSLFLEVIKKAKENSDYVVAYVHWGTEYSIYADNDQKTQGKEYIDAGADIVLGGHSHCLQGIEYYEGKPIIYSLSDFWFNDWTTDTALLKVNIGNNNETQLEYLPCIQTELKTTLITDESERVRILNHVEEISYDVNIDEGGIVTPRQE
ncbi:MAG: Bacterial capsule synthesis protein cap [Clostridiales bacterium]|jgi:poly-gamma-glutamate synthesis protein (capsule biosynthesis protein)|nr:Bacterial capsule synthesis protein cap [Clostridiales bacterium]